MKLFLLISITLNVFFITKAIINKSESDSVKNADFNSEYFKIKSIIKNKKTCIYFYNTINYSQNTLPDLKYLYNLSLENKSVTFIIVDVNSNKNQISVTNNLIYNNGNLALYNSIRNKLKMQIKFFPMLTIIENDSIILNHTLGNISKINHAIL